MGLVDNFDSYTDGDLNGQGSWSGSTDFDIQGSVVQAGAKAVAHTAAASGNILKSFTGAASGTQSIYGRVASTAISGLWMVRLYEGAAARIFIQTDGAGNLSYNDGGGLVTIGAITADTWFKLDIEWQASDDTARYRLDNGTWTAFDTIVFPITTEIDTLRLFKDVADATAIYFDTAAEVGGDVVVTPQNQPTLLMLGVG